MKQVILTLSLIVASTFAFAQAPMGKGQMKEKNQAARAEENAKVKAACSAEIATSGCKEDLGQGLLRCVHAYHEAHKDFKVSDACHNVVKEEREERHERREERKEMRAQRKGGATPAVPAVPATTSH